MKPEIPFNKYMAVCLISSELHAYSRTKTGLRTLRACAKYLDFDNEDLIKLETACGYRSDATGKLYKQWEGVK